MAGESDFLRILQQRLALFDESALEAISSKGLVRRARKDVESGIAVEIVAGTISDIKLRVAEAVVTITEQGPSKAHCSCPALEVCRHILIACLWLLEAGKEESPLREPVSSDLEITKDDRADQEILNYSLPQLIKWAGKKIVRAGFVLLGGNQEIEIKQEGSVVVQFPLLNMVCRYFPGVGLEAMICSCKPRMVCKHMVAAVLAYQRSRGVMLEEPERSAPTQAQLIETPRTRTEVISTTKRLLEEAINIGICHLSESTRQRFATLAVSALGLNLPRLSLTLRAIAEDLGLSISRDARADEGRLLLSASRAYALCTALENGAQSADLIGRNRTHYEELGTIELAGVGAYHWETKSGYAGLTVLFWDLIGKRWYSWSEARPLFHDIRFDPRSRYYTQGPWPGLYSPQQASYSRFKLLTARSNYQNRLSGAAQCEALIIGNIDPAEIDFGSRSFDDWKALRSYTASAIAMGLSEYDPLKQIVVLKPAKWGPRQFDETTQTFLWLIGDHDGNVLTLRVQFDSVNKERIKCLETLDPDKECVIAIVAQIILGSELALYPISLLCGSRQGLPSVINLSFAMEKEKKDNIDLESTQGGKKPVLEEVDDLPATEPIMSPEATNNSLEQRVLLISDELERIAEQGSSFVTSETRKRLKNSAVFLNAAGLMALASQIGSLSEADENIAPLLLRARYICRLCEEAALKTIYEI
jgi:hypothetical protein